LDRDGKFLLAFGEKGTPPNDERPGTFDAVHGVVVDPQTRRVFATDRSSGRIQIFDENGKYLDQFRVGNPSNPQVLYASNDRHLWIADSTTSKIIKYDMEGRYQYSWGSQGEWPGAMWNPHGMSVDEAGNMYLAEVNNGRVQKFVPKPDADRAHLIAPPLRAVQ
jgi:DNA-binding beta-propeller fold protein YncE